MEEFKKLKLYVGINRSGTPSFSAVYGGKFKYGGYSISGDVSNYWAKIGKRTAEIILTSKISGYDIINNCSMELGSNYGSAQVTKISDSSLDILIENLNANLKV